MATQNLPAAAGDGEGLLANAHGEVENVNSGVSIYSNGSHVSTRDGQLCRLREQRADEDQIVHQLSTSRDAQWIVGASGSMRNRAIPVNNFIRIHRRRRRASLVGSNIRPVYITPAIVGEAIGPLGGPVIAVVGL